MSLLISSVSSSPNEVSMNSPKKSFSSKYENLLKQIAEVSEHQNNIIPSKHEFSPKRTNEHYSLFSNDLKINKQNSENIIDKHLCQAKLNLLTGKTLDNIPFKKFNTSVSPINAVSHTITTPTNNNIHNKNISTLRQFKKYLNKKPESSSYPSKLFKDYSNNSTTTRNNEPNTFTMYSNININGTNNNNSNSNSIVNKLRNTFPEYMQYNHNGQSFILRNDISLNKHKITQLKNKIDKI